MGESRFLMGRPILRELLRGYPHKIRSPVVEHWWLSIDVPLNRVLYAAAERALGQARVIRVKALETLSLLEDAEELEHWIPRDVRSVKFNRLNERFREAYTLACLMLGYLGLVGRDALIFVFSTPRLFEEYVYRVLLRELGGAKTSVMYQSGIEDRLYVDGKPKTLRPDIVL